MEYTIITKEQANLIEGFIAEDLYEGFADHNRFAVCATKNDVLCGVGIFDANPVMEILDVITLPEYRGKLETKILNIILSAFGKLPCKAVKMDVYEEPENEELTRALLKTGFTETGRSILYRFPLEDLYDNPRFGAAASGEGIRSLFEVPDRAKKAFSNFLIQNSLYENFLAKDIDDTISTVYTAKDDRILGCVLVKIIDEGSFYVDFVYADPEAPKYALPAMLREGADALRAYYQDGDADGFILSTDARSDQLVTKTLANAYIVDVCTTYTN